MDTHTKMVVRKKKIKEKRKKRKEKGTITKSTVTKTNKRRPKMAQISKNKNFPKNDIWGSLYPLMPSNFMQNMKKI